MTVKELKEWLADKDDSFPIELMIETEEGQWQFPMTDMALSTTKVIFIREPYMEAFS